ncbi:hypothetical protein L1887_23718 [Cichorium endivia]|nr:hypothetical protein L1887_23718 [Cichorium endivia]
MAVDGADMCGVSVVGVDGGGFVVGDVAGDMTVVESFLDVEMNQISSLWKSVILASTQIVFPYPVEDNSVPSGGLKITCFAFVEDTLILPTV